MKLLTDGKLAYQADEQKWVQVIERYYGDRMYRKIGNGSWEEIPYFNWGPPFIEFILPKSYPWEASCERPCYL